MYKKLITPICLSLALALFANTSALAKPTIVAIAPNTPLKIVERIYQEEIRQVVKGDTLMFYDAKNMNEICHFKIPHKKKMNRFRHKKKVGQRCHKALLIYVNGKNSDDLKINLPDLLHEIEHYHRAYKNTDVIIYGNVIFTSDDKPEFSMVDKIPLDGCFNSLPKFSPYSVTDKNGKPLSGLGKMEFNLAFPKQDWLDDQHKRLTEDVWGKMITAMGGKLITFHQGLDIAFGAIRDRTRISPREYPLSASTKLEMQHLRETVVLKDEPIFTREISDERLPLKKVKKATNVQFGISWDCKCDNDLWLKINANSEVVSYKNSRTKEAILFKDFTSSTVANNSFETIQVDAPFVDLSQIKIRVNLYSGSPPDGISKIKFRVSVHGKTYEGQYEIHAESGNSGAGQEAIFKSDNPPNNHWVVIDIMKLIGLGNE